MNFADLPCYENAQRLARVEERLAHIIDKLEDMADHPCSRCQNAEELTRLRTEVSWIKRVGYVSLASLGAVMFAYIEEWIK